jgi:predicted ester cyclase
VGPKGCGSFWRSTAGPSATCGELMGAPPSGAEIAFNGVTISRCRDDKIVEEWETCDTLSLLQQIGAVPATP